MSKPALATPAELAVWVNQTIASDDARALALLDAASAEVRAAAHLDWIVEGGGLDPDLPQVAKNVTLAAARREWVNPTGATRHVTGPFQGEWDTSGVGLTEDERVRVAGLNTSSAAAWGIGTISTTRGPIETRSVLDGCGSEPWDVVEADTPFELWDET